MIVAVDGGGEFGDQASGERIQRLRPVQGDQPDAAARLGEDERGIVLSYIRYRWQTGQ